MEINQPEEKRRLTRRQAISLILAGLGLILLVTGLWMMRSPEAPPERGLELSAVSLAEGWSLSQVRQDYPVGKLVVTTDREAYENGNLRLVIPSLDQDKSRRLLPIPGSPPDMTKPPLGCPFAPRCPYARVICGQSLPEMRALSKDHKSRCWLLEPDAPSEHNPFSREEGTKNE